MDRRHYRLSLSDRLTGLPLAVDSLFRFIAKRDLDSARRVERARVARSLSPELSPFETAETFEKPEMKCAR